MHDRPLDERYCDVRSRTEVLCEPLSAEDQTVQSMPDVSPTKWHRGHTTWFFEEFVLAGTKHAGTFDPDFEFIFNSYYESVGPRFERARRGVLSRPGIGEVARYRVDVDHRMRELLAGEVGDDLRTLVVLGLHHEQQHQELLLMDAKHVLAQHPHPTGYAQARLPRRHDQRRNPGVIEVDEGTYEVGALGDAFCFDNELPRHTVFVTGCSIDAALVTCDAYVEFIEDGGYERPELWLSEGWAAIHEHGWTAPLYWSRTDGSWHRFTMFGIEAIAGSDPVSHLSYYEADAYARWRGARLPTEAEWEVVAVGQDLDAEFALEPPSTTDGTGFFGSVWQWTQSAYAPYPGFHPAAGAVGEYNGKFMVNQQVLRGSASITPPGHARATYRNFFPASARWAYAGLRLAHDAT